MIDVSIIIINYKTANLVRDAINSILSETKGCSFEIIVVDNSNDRKEHEILIKALKDYDIKIVDSQENAGFGKGNNYGASFANGQYLLFLNSDTLLKNDAITQLFKYISEHENVGVVGPNLFKIDNSKNNSYELHEKNLSLDCRGFIYSHLRRKIRKNEFFNSSGKPLTINGYICGACLMIKKSVFNELGGFDTDIFMYAEDSLICYRVKNEMKLRIVNVPQAEIIHFEGASFSTISSVRANYIAHGNYIYYKKCYGEKIAIKYLKKSIKKFKQKRFLCNFCKSKKNLEIENVNNLINSYELELEHMVSKI